MTKPMTNLYCPDCGARPDQVHMQRCGMEMCICGAPLAWDSLNKIDTAARPLVTVPVTHQVTL
jgi:hypothetical protein